MEKLSVQLMAPHLWPWLLLLLPALALAFWSYYRILAPLSRPSRWTLWCLRGAAFLLVLLALWQPVVTAVLRQTGKPALAVLIDRSASMGLPAGSADGDREAQATQIARQTDRALKDRFRLRWYGFSEDAREVNPDSAASAAGNTGLGQALEQVLTQANSRPVSGVLIISDGVSTVGRDPVRVAVASPVPVFTVPVGPSDPVADVEVRRVRTNPTAFTGERLPVQVVLSSWGMAGRTVRVQAKDHDTVLAEKDVQLAGERGTEQEVNLEVRPRAPGLTLLDVSAAGVRDSVPQNDHRQIAVRVLDRKTRILVVAGHLDWDFAFLRRTLGADTSLAYTFLVQDRPGSWSAYGEKRVTRPPEGTAELRDFAAVILLAAGEGGTPAPFCDALAGFVREGGGLFLLGGTPRLTGSAGLGSLASVLPGRVGPDPLPQSRSLPVTLTLEGQRHAATAVRDNPAEAAQLWASLPPLWRPQGSLEPNPEAKVLLTYRSPRAEQPAAMVVSYAGRGKVAWIYGQGIWRWGFLPAGSPTPNDLYPQFLLALARWLAEPAMRDQFQVAPGKLVYQNGEPVAFSASLWNTSYAPISGARISVEVRSAADSSAAGRSFDLEAGGDPGRYDGEGSALAPGAYLYHAAAREAGSGRELGRAAGRFWVEAMGPEYTRTWADRDQLAQIARASGGATAEPASLASLLDKIPRLARRQGRVREIDVWNHWLLFTSFVAVLSAEWFLRRRRGMA